MRIPVIADLRKLDPGPRRFLFFIVFNVVSWQSIVGPALILFARSLDMKPSWIGFLIAFMPLSMLLVGFTAGGVNRFGPKRVMFAGWALRNLLTCSVFLIPFARGWGAHYAQYVLMAAILAFCILRATGAGGWLPWLHELVPDKQRGTYFSMESAVTQLTTVVVATAQALLLRGEPNDWRFLMVYAIGIGAGLISLGWMASIPGGKSVHIKAAPVLPSIGYLGVLRDRGFVAFVTTAALGYSCITWLIGSSLVLYMRDVLHYDASTIIGMTAAGGFAVFLTISSWGRLADYAGSARAIFWSMAGHTVCAGVCFVLTPGAAWTPMLVWSVFVTASVFSAAFQVAVNRAMLGYVPPHSRVMYTNLWSIGTSLALGVTPIAAGYLIDHLHIGGFRFCFLLAGLTGLACGAMSLRFVREGVVHRVSNSSGNPGAEPLCEATAEGRPARIAS